MKMRTLTIIAIVCFAMTALAGQELATGITANVASNGDLWLTLDPGKCVLVRQAGKEGFVSISDTDGALMLVQVEKDGQTPFSAQIVSPTQQMVTIERGQGESHTMFLDRNGDGIPEKKIVGPKNAAKPKCYLLKTIEWEEMTAENE